MTYIGRQYRQGDLLLIEEERLPLGLEVISPPPGCSEVALMETDVAKQGSHIVPIGPMLSAYREVGPHAASGWLEVHGTGVTVRHAEHAPIYLEPGVWRVIPQRQYDPAKAAPRRVAD